MIGPRIVLADDDALTRQGLAELLILEADIASAQGFGSSEDLTSKDWEADLVLLADSMDRRSTDDLCRQTVDRAPVLVLARGDVQSVLLSVLEAGGLGVVPTSVGYDELLHSIRAALRGEACVPRGMLGGLLRGLIERRRGDDRALAIYARLTGREREVLQLLGRGADLDQIARTLFVSPQTVRSHLQHVLEKLEVHTRAEAVAFLLEHDLLDPAPPGASR